MLNSRHRFLETMRNGRPDRVPLFGEGIRPDVFEAWNQPRLDSKQGLAGEFVYDPRKEILLDLEPHPELKRWPSTEVELDRLRRRLDPRKPKRWPRDWGQQVAALRERDYPLMLRVHRGFFLSMGVYQWDRFHELMILCTDAPDFVRTTMKLQGEFAAQMTKRVLQDVSVDAVIFSEPIGGNHGPLISPQMYEDFVLNSYRPVFDVLSNFEVEIIILRTYANARVLLPHAVEHGFNCLWACETDQTEMDFLDIRRQFGTDLRLIGGLDTDVLLQSQDAIRQEVERVVPPLLEEGGYVPLLDGRVREYIPYHKYRFYRELLQDIVIGSQDPKGFQNL